MINTQAVPHALEMGGKEAYHSPGELDIFSFFLTVFVVCRGDACDYKLLFYEGCE